MAAPAPSNSKIVRLVRTINENGILTYTAGYVETELRTARTTNLSKPKQGGRKRTHKRK